MFKTVVDIPVRATCCGCSTIRIWWCCKQYFWRVQL